MSARIKGSLGFELPVPGDPVKLHGLATDQGARWRCECMACGSRLSLRQTPGAARADCIRHVASATHRQMTA